MNDGIRNVKIAKPCKEDWHRMLPNEQGRFCASCQKTVTDFTSLSNTQIIAVLTSATSVCGRFDDMQLATLNRELTLTGPRPLFWQKFGLAAIIAGLIPFMKSEAGVKQGGVKYKLSVSQVSNPPKSKHLLKKTKGRADTLKAKSIGFADSNTIPSVLVPDTVSVKAVEETCSVVMGGVVARQSFFRRVYYSFTRPIRKLFN